MKIGIDARFYNESGVGRYLRNLINNLQNLDKKNEYFIFLLAKDFDNFKQEKNFQKVSANFNWYGFAEQFKFPNLLKKYNLNLVHFPHFNVPIFYNRKFVVTIHDLIHQHFQMKRTTTLNPLRYKIKQFGYRKVFRTAIKKSAQILVPSMFVREGLINEWNVDGNKIMVTPEAVDNKLAATASIMKEEESERIIGKLKIKEPYIFYVGNAHPHKNVEGLIEAFRQLRKKYSNLALVLSGYDHYFWRRIKMENTYEGIIYTDYISDEELVALYKKASCFVMPSFEEGFGIPIIEAMNCDCPVVSSNAGSLPEVGGDACMYFNPQDRNDMVGKISQVIKDEKIRKILIDKGKKRVKQFSWEKLAKKTLEVYKQCA